MTHACAVGPLGQDIAPPFFVVVLLSLALKQ